MGWMSISGRRKQQSMRLPQREQHKGKLVWVSLFVMADMNKFVPLWMVDDCELGDDLDETQERDQNPCAVEALTKALGLPQAKKKKGTRER